MSRVLSSISCNLDENILAAAFPLFESGEIEALEWSFDTLFKIDTVPAWFTELLQTFGKEKRLTGHGVYYSIFSGKWLDEQDNWLRHLKMVSATFSFDHISEHFGFMTGKNFHHGAPVSIPFTPATLAIGRDRLKRIYDSCRCPVGLENLAFSYSLDDVKIHGQFLEQLIEPVNGFIILDLHNVYCQVNNFNIAFDDIIQLYPLHRVREIHISGGSWESSATKPRKKIRRDTHDDAVPPQVFALLKQAIPKCTNLKYVVMEQMGHSLDTKDKRKTFRQHFITMSAIVKEFSAHCSTQNNFLPFENITLSAYPPEDRVLYEQQMALSVILEHAISAAHAAELLQSSGLANTVWKTEEWDSYMLETAIAIAQKWKTGYD